MSGVPVVIAGNGIGIPIKAVPVDDLNYDRVPVLTIAANGRGAPIVISDRGAPFKIEGYQPPEEP